MIPPTMNFNRSSSYFRCEKDSTGSSPPFSRVIPVASNSTEPDFSALCSLFASVNDLRLQDIAVKVSSAVSPSVYSSINNNSSTYPYEYISNKNVIVSTQLVDGQGYSFLDRGAVSMRLIKGFLEDPCVWESERKSWKRSMGRMRNPQPFIACPKDLPVIPRHEFVPDSLCLDYMSLTAESSELLFDRHTHAFGKIANGNGEASDSKKLMAFDNPYEPMLSTNRGIKVESAGNNHVMNSDGFSISSRSPINNYDTSDDISCSSSEDDNNEALEDDDNSEAFDDDDSSETDDYASDEDFSVSEPSSWLMNMISMSLQYF